MSMCIHWVKFKKHYCSIALSWLNDSLVSTPCFTQTSRSDWGHKAGVWVHHWTSAAGKRKIILIHLWGFMLPYVFVLFSFFFFLLALSSWPWHDRLARLLKWSGCPVLKEDLSHYKQKWRGQSNHCSRLRTLCQCQTLCCLDSARWGSGAGIWECTKGLLNHQIVAATERDCAVFPPEWDVFFFFLIITTAACYLCGSSVV